MLEQELHRLREENKEALTGTRKEMRLESEKRELALREALGASRDAVPAPIPSNGPHLTAHGQHLRAFNSSTRWTLLMRLSGHTLAFQAEMKIDQLRKMADQQHKETMALKEQSDESARVAWAEAQKALAETDEATARLASEKKDRGMQKVRPFSRVWGTILGFRHCPLSKPYFAPHRLHHSVATTNGFSRVYTSIRSEK
eukprot:1194069-Prorocentrum_minimum.AAC.3